MKILALVLALLCGGGVAYYLSIERTQVGIKNAALPPLPCNLNTQACEIESPLGRLRFEASPRPLSVYEKTHIIVRGIQSPLSDPKLRIYGLNMDMGQLIASMRPLDSGAYEAWVALSACVVENIMRYEIALYEGNTPLGARIAFDMAR